jgi:hypothetical protein
MDECGYIEASPFQGLEEIEIQKDTGILGMGKSVNSQTKKLTYFKSVPQISLIIEQFESDDYTASGTLPPYGLSDYTKYR